MTPTATDSPKAYNIAVPNTTDLATTHVTLLAEAEALKVTDQNTHALALDGLRRATEAERAVDALFDEPVSAANKAHKFLTGLRSTVKAHPSRAKALFGAKAIEYEAEARRQAEEEARRREEAARKAEQDRLLADAVSAGTPEEQEAILNEPVTVPVVHVAPAVAKVAGVTSRTTYGAAGDNLNAFLCHIAGVPRLKHPELVTGVTFNGPGLNALARAMRDNLNLPGVRLVKELSKSVRSA